jgi:AcrR family transcriptional regulator
LVVPATRKRRRSDGAEPARLTEIRVAATRLFAERGYLGVSMHDIADAVGIRAPSLYHFVGAKHELLREIALTTTHANLRNLREAEQLSDDVAEQVRLCVEQQVRFRIRFAYENQVLTRETLNLDEAGRAEVITSRDAQREIWRGIVERGVELSRFTTPSAELSSHLLQEMGNWTQIIHFSLELQLPEVQLAFWYADVALRMLGADQSPGRTPPTTPPST